LKSRLNLVLIALVCIAPLALGTLAYVLHWTPGEPANYGELIDPRPLTGAPFDALRGKWVLVSIDAPACDAYCERKLYFIRQARRAQGKDEDRVERLWLLTSPAQPRAEVLAAIQGTHVARAGPELIRVFPGVPSEHVFLVDPLGNLMLRFPPDPDPTKALKDLQRLLKYSRIG
jgi:hypothetical protein